MSEVFAPALLSVLVYAALAASGIGVSILVVLLLRDIKDGNLW